MDYYDLGLIRTTAYIILSIILLIWSPAVEKSSQRVIVLVRVINGLHFLSKT